MMFGEPATTSEADVQRLREQLSALEVENARLRGLVQQSEQTEHRLRQMDVKFRRLWETSLFGVYHASLQGAITDANEAFLQLLSYSREQLRDGQLHWRQMTPLQWHEADEHALEALRHTGVAPAWEKEFLRHDGTHVPVRVTSALVPGFPEEVLSVVTDLSERKRSEERLRQSDAQFRQFADSLPQLVWSTRADGFHDYYNQRWFDYTGLTLEQTQGEGWSRLLHPQDFDPAWQRWQHSLETGEPYEIEYRFRRHDGEYCWFLGRAHPMRDPAGRIIRWFGTCTDIDGQKQSASALRESQERLRAALSASSTSTFRWDIQGGRLHGDEAMPQVFDGSGEPIRSFAEFLDRVHESDRAKVESHFHRSQEHGADLELEFRLQNTGGPPIWLHCRGKVFRDAQQRPKYMAGAFTDISGRRRSEDALARSEHRLRLALKAAHMGTWEIDLNHRRVAATESTNQLFGLAPGRTRRSLDSYFRRVHPADQEAVARIVTDQPQSRGEHLLEFRVLLPHGEIRWLASRGEWLPATESEGPKLLGAVMDVTEQKQSEIVLRDSHAELEQLAYVASHDLQEPLRSITSYTQLLAKRYRGQLDRDADEFIDYIVEAALRMQLLIRDLLAYSRVLHLNRPGFRPVPLIAALREGLYQCKEPLRQSGGEVHFDELPVVMGDVSLLSQVFANLISNAVKYGKPGEKPRVEIGAQRRGAYWQVEVRDHGIGFEPEYAEQIFGLFKKLHNRAQYQGNGVGLALSRRILENHGGKIWAESQPGEGANFRFVLPAVEETPAAGDQE